MEKGAYGVMENKINEYEMKMKTKLYDTTSKWMQFNLNEKWLSLHPSLFVIQAKKSDFVLWLFATRKPPKKFNYPAAANKLHNKRLKKQFCRAPNITECFRVVIAFGWRFRFGFCLPLFFPNIFSVEIPWWL